MVEPPLTETAAKEQPAPLVSPGEQSTPAPLQKAVSDQPPPMAPSLLQQSSQDLRSPDSDPQGDAPKDQRDPGRRRFVVSTAPLAAHIPQAARVAVAPAALGSAPPAAPILASSYGQSIDASCAAAVVTTAFNTAFDGAFGKSTSDPALPSLTDAEPAPPSPTDAEPDGPAPTTDESAMTPALADDISVGSTPHSC